jgi:hypothetical protein
MAAFLKVARKRLADLPAAAGQHNAQGARNGHGENLHGFSVQRLLLLGRERIAPEQEPAAVGAIFADDNEDDQSDDNQRNEENPAGLDDAIVADEDRFRSAYAAKQGHHILADGDVFAQPDDAEEAYQVLADGDVVLCRDFAEEIDDIVSGDAGQMDISEEDNDVAGDLALDVYAAKKADGVVNRGIAGYVDVGAELDRVLAGEGGGGGDGKSGAEQAND